MRTSKDKPYSRRDFFNVVKRVGLTSALFAAGTLGTGATLSSLANASESVSRTREKKKPIVVLKFGASGFNEQNLDIQKSGQLFFARDLEERTNGEIQVEFFGSNQLCGQLDCIRKTQQGIVDIYSASTQNSAAAAPYMNVLDFAYMFPTRASQFHFFYDKRSETLFREPLRKRHNIQFLFTHCDLRGLMLGNKWKDKPLVTSLADIQGTKNRVTGTQLGRIAMEQLNLNPVPVAWAETIDGLRQGLLDGAETWMSAAAYSGMTSVISQAIDLRMFSGNESTAMNYDVFEKLSDKHKEAVMESAYCAQIFTHGMNEGGLYEIIGAQTHPNENTQFRQNNIRFAALSDEERFKAEQICSPEYNPEPWQKWRNRLNAWAGDIDIYKEIHGIARELPKDAAVVNVKPQRWWLG